MHYAKKGIHDQVTVPVRGIRLHLNQIPLLSAEEEKGYCPREGYKVASSKIYNTRRAAS